MKKIKIEQIDEFIYYDKLDNGLDVYFYVNENVHNNYVTFTTKYGSVYNNFNVENDNKTYPNGIAHFLEHKVFGQEKGLQPEEFFSNNGGYSNAYTTFKNTTYLFSSCDKIYDNVEFLLDFVQNLYLTDENVASEKGIILQEINMCNDNPGNILYDSIRKYTIKNNPFKESIIGDKKDIEEIDKEMLTECYNLFYNPGNMFLVVTGNFDVEKMLETVKANQQEKEFSKQKEITLDTYKEPDDIVCKKKEIKCNTNIPKIAYNLKINIAKFGIDKRKLIMYLYILFDLLFGETSDFDEEMKANNIITNCLSYNLLDIDSHFIISLVNSLDKFDELISKIDKRLDDVKINENDFERKKKVLISNEVFSYEDVEVINDIIVDNLLFNGKIENNIVGLIKSLNYNELKNIIDILFTKRNYKKNIIILHK